jgi:cytochrome d ubiquinol oxidase subunit II
VNDEGIKSAVPARVIANAVPFLIFFVAFAVNLLTKDGWSVGAHGVVCIEENKYLNNFLAMPHVLLLFLAGVVCVIAGIAVAVFKKCGCAIWYAGVGTVLTVLALLLIAGWNNTCYYPSLADMQSSLHLANSSSSEFTLTVMTIVSVLVPFVLAYIVWAWRTIDKGGLDKSELHY